MVYNDQCCGELRKILHLRQSIEVLTHWLIDIFLYLGVIVSSFPHAVFYGVLNKKFYEGVTVIVRFICGRDKA